MLYCVSYVSLFDNEMQMCLIKDDSEESALLRGIQYFLRIDDTNSNASTTDPLTDTWLMNMLKSAWSVELITQEMDACDTIVGVIPIEGT